MNRTKALAVAFIRTSLVPPVAGFILTWAVAHGITINSTWVYTAATIMLSGIYYIGLHMVEIIASNPTIKKWAGIFLGYPTAPTYQEKL